MQIDQIPYYFIETQKIGKLNLLRMMQQKEVIVLLRIMNCTEETVIGISSIQGIRKEIKKYNNWQKVYMIIQLSQEYLLIWFQSEHNFCLNLKIVWMSQANSSCFCIQLFRRWSGQNQKPIWFNPYEMHSLAEWVVYMLQSQIKNAFVQYKQKLKLKNTQKSQQTFTFYKFIREAYKQQGKIKPLIQKVILQNLMKDDLPQKQNYNEKKNFYLKKCIDRISQQYDKQEYFVSYSWFYQNDTNQNFKIMNKVSLLLFEEFKNWRENRQLTEWMQNQEKERQKKIDKRKRKREKRQKEKGVEGPQSQQNQETKQEVKQIYSNNQNIVNQMKKKQQQKDKKLITENKKQTTEEKISKKQLKKPEQKKMIIKQIIPISKPKQKIVTKIQEQKNIQKSTPISHKIEQHQQQKGHHGKNNKNNQNNQNKKIIKQRINEYYQFFCQQLSQTASVYDKYRKIVYLVIENFFREEFFGQNKQKQESNQKNWKLEVYGSASAGFSLRHSDIDIVLLADQQKITLYEIYERLRLKQWAIDCKFIQAQIPLITLQVNLHFSKVAYAQLNQKQFKKIQNQLFSVDLTLSPIGQPHSGIQNTKQLKQIFQTYPSIRNVCLLLKQFFWIRNLHKPYKGGINSYILIMLVHAILSRKGIIPPKDEQTANDQFRKIKEISHFMQNQYIPYQTVISSKKNCQTKADKALHLNIVNPKTEHLLKTSAFKIQTIILQLKKFQQFQQQIEKELQSINIQEKRNMKHLFLEKFKNFLNIQH